MPTSLECDLLGHYAELERREQSLRDNWAEMSDSARETAQARLRELREARNTLGERYGALQSGTNSAWEVLMAEQNCA
jgi:hypothetical protein